MVEMFQKQGLEGFCEDLPIILYKKLVWPRMGSLLLTHFQKEWWGFFRTSVIQIREKSGFFSISLWGNGSQVMIQEPPGLSTWDALSHFYALALLSYLIPVSAISLFRLQGSFAHTATKLDTEAIWIYLFIHMTVCSPWTVSFLVKGRKISYFISWPPFDFQFWQIISDQ